MIYVIYNLQCRLPHVITYHIVMPESVNWEDKLAKKKKIKYETKLQVHMEHSCKLKKWQGFIVLQLPYQSLLLRIAFYASHTPFRQQGPCCHRTQHLAPFCHVQYLRQLPYLKVHTETIKQHTEDLILWEVP